MPLHILKYWHKFNVMLLISWCTGGPWGTTSHLTASCTRLPNYLWSGFEIMAAAALLQVFQLYDLITAQMFAIPPTSLLLIRPIQDSAGFGLLPIHWSPWHTYHLKTSRFHFEEESHATHLWAIWLPPEVAILFSAPAILLRQKNGVEVAAILAHLHRWIKMVGALVRLLDGPGINCSVLQS